MEDSISIGFIDNLKFFSFERWKNCENLLRFDKVMLVSMWLTFFGPPCKRNNTTPKMPINLSQKIWLFLTACNSCRLYDDAETWSIYQTVWYFLWRKTDVLNIATVKYSVQESGKPYYTKMMIRPLFTIYSTRYGHLCVFQHIGFHQSRVLDISKRAERWY